MRHFTSLRGKIKIYKYSPNPNPNLVRQRFQFHWNNKQPTIDIISTEDDDLKKFINALSTKWIVNPPHSSHFGWVWKKMMGLVRKIVYHVLMEPCNQNIIHGILCISVTEIITSQLPTVDTSGFDLFSCSHPMYCWHENIFSFDFDCPEFSGISVDMLKSYQKCVQDPKMWNSAYLHLLHPCRKWKSDESNIKEGDIV